MASSGVIDNWENDQPTEITAGGRIVKTTNVTETRLTTFTFENTVGVEKETSIPLLADVKLSWNFKFGLSHQAGQTISKADSVWDSVSITTTLPAYSKKKYEIFRLKTKSSVRYRVIVNVRFNSEIDGFLRWGGGRTPESNYHLDHYGSGARPTFVYAIGDETYSFAEDLRYESDRSMYPWDWYRLFREHPTTRGIVQRLTDAEAYQFPLEGRLEMIDGSHFQARLGRTIYNPDYLNSEIIETLKEGESEMEWVDLE